MFEGVPVSIDFLQWSSKCDSLVRLVQSNMRDGITKKVLLADRAVSIRKLECVEESACAKAPGTVLAIEENSWFVATADGMVKISEFLDEFGQPISAQTIAKKCDVTEGDQLPIITSEQAELIAKSYAQAMSAETYWTQKLKNFERAQRSIVKINGTQLSAWATTSQQSSKYSSAIDVLTAWLIYIARDVQMSKIQIGWDATESGHEDNEISTGLLFAKTVPFGTTIDLNDTFSGVVSSVKRDYNELVNHLPCLSDILTRHAAGTNLSGKQQWALAVSLIDTLNENEHFLTDVSEIAPHAHGSLITLQINKKSGAFQWIYDQNQISEGEVSRISSHLLALLDSAHTQDKANEPVAKLNLLPKAERDLLLYTWNQTTVANSLNRCLHQLFEEQVKRDGQAIAVELNGQTLSYAKLNAQSNRLAHYLIDSGIKPDDIVALCVERSTTMIVAILAILKSGGAYVPIDPAYPSQRLTQILQDANPKLLLTDVTGRKVLGGHQVPVFGLEQPLRVDLTCDNPDASKLRLTPNHLAYVLYTSGSTGTPKGVMVEHQQVIRLFEVTKDKFDFSKQDKWCLFHSFSFDVSVWEMWGAVLNGSQLSIIPYNIVRSPEEFYDWICRNEVTVLNITPSAFKMLRRTKNIISRSDKLRYIIFAGEELDPHIVKEWNEKYDESQTVLVNMYGPTEATIYAAYQRIESLENAYSIGRPLPDVCAYLLDSYGEPVPLGTEGELYIGGAGVARGYLNRPELTAERFLFNPFSDDPAARMYRTGDRARYLPDGNLIYLGRADQQVKIRGFRIELGEIEAHLVAHPQVQEVVVRPHGNGPDARLVAYVVTDADSSIAKDLRSYLSNLLPEYMIPAAYVRLPSLPLTPNGKLDSRALPVPDDEAFARQQYEAPQGEMEEKLAEIWSELLNIDRVSRHDNFFELGGHSLLVMQFINEAKLCNLNIDARGVFLFPTLKDLVEQIAKRGNRMYCDVAIPIRQYGNETPLFLLPEGLGGISYGFELAHDIDKSIPVYMLPWSSPEDKQPSSIEEMAHAMISLMKRVQACGPYSIAAYSAGGIVAYEMAKQLINTGQTVSFLGLIDTYLSLKNRRSKIELETETKTETEAKMLFFYLLRNFPVFKTISDLEWWSNIIKLSHDEVIEEIKKPNIDLKNFDFEWEELLSNQRHNFLNICEYVNVDPLPIKIHFFRATDSPKNSLLFPHLDHIFMELTKQFAKMIKFPLLGWDNYDLSIDFDVISVDGDHVTMLTDPKYRSLLGKKLTKSLLSSKKIATEMSEFHEI